MNILLAKSEKGEYSAQENHFLAKIKEDTFLGCLPSKVSTHGGPNVLCICYNIEIFGLR